MTTHYNVRPGAESYGYEIGILLVDVKGTPFIPGDVANASSYDFPVLYKSVPGLSLERLIEQGDPTLVESIVHAARELEQMGVKAITSDCGYMIRFQEDVSSAVRVPVLLSSLLQLPMLSNMLGAHQRVGIVCANQKRLTPELLAIAGIGKDTPVPVRGLENQPFFRDAILDEKGTLNFEAVEEEVVSTAKALVRDNPDVACILLECSNLPPYAHVIQRELNMPVFDYISMINYIYRSLHRKPFIGTY